MEQKAAALQFDVSDIPLNVMTPKIAYYLLTKYEGQFLDNTLKINKMRIAILGTRSVGQTIASKLNQLGHQVLIGIRDVAV